MSVDSDKNLNSMYDLQKHLGEGCFGIIYRATNKTTNRECALKIEGFKHHAKQTLKKEYSMLKTLEGLDGVPAAYAFGRSDYFYLI
jgi:predicted Ser/Thr protein kinase